VAFPRTNVVPASPARETVGAVARAAERRADVRRSDEFIMPVIVSLGSIELRKWLSMFYVSRIDFQTVLLDHHFRISSY
jgi:hypothetical protein